MEPTIYKPSIYKGAGIYKAGAAGGGGGAFIIEGYEIKNFAKLKTQIGGLYNGDLYRYRMDLNDYPISTTNKTFITLCQFFTFTPNVGYGNSWVSFSDGTNKTDMYNYGSPAASNFLENNPAPQNGSFSDNRINAPIIEYDEDLKVTIKNTFARIESKNYDKSINNIANVNGYNATLFYPFGFPNVDGGGRSGFFPKVFKYAKVLDENDNLIFWALPAIRLQDNCLGIYELITGKFIEGFNTYIELG